MKKCAVLRFVRFFFLFSLLKKNRKRTAKNRKRTALASRKLSEKGRHERHMAKKLKFNLIGLWFHTRDSHGEIKQQGQVVDVDAEGKFRCQFYSFLDGTATNIIRMELHYMKNWSFYLSDETMRARWESEQSPEDAHRHIRLTGVLPLDESPAADEGATPIARRRVNLFGERADDD